MGKPSSVDSEKYRVSAHLDRSMLVWGTVDAVGDQVLTAGATVTLTVEATLAQAIQAGQSIEVWTHFVSDIQRPQTTSGSEAACFACEGEGVQISAFVHPDAKVHGPGSFFPYRRYAGVRLQQGAPTGARFRFRIENVRMQTYEETLLNLRFAIMDGDSVVGYLGDAFYVVKGAGRDHLQIIAPTRVQLGELIDCTIVTRDRYGNKTGDPLADLVFEIVLDAGEGTLGFEEITFDAQRQHHVVHNTRFDRTGVYYLLAYLRDDVTVRGVSNPIVVKESWPARVYWGDMHQHAYYADGRGTPAANYEYAISTSRLDFCAVADHQEATFNAPLVHLEGAPPQTGWEELQAAAATYNGEAIVTILGSEAGSLYSVAGHMNAYYLDPDNRPEFERMGLSYRSGQNINLWSGDPETFYQRYLDELERSKGDVLLLPHAHACGGPGKFDLPKRPDYQTNIEICSVHGVFEEFYRQWLKHRHFVGVHGSGDNHMTSTGNGNPGYHYPNTNGLAAAVAESRTRQGIWDAFKHRCTYAVTGNQRIHLDFAINGAAMGTVLAEDTPTRAIHVEVAGTAPLLKAELYRNNALIRTYEPSLERRVHLRMVWTDSWGSRRVDDSLTTGSISLDAGQLTVRERLHMYHHTDRIEATPDGARIGFRTNGYSGITRGALLEVANASHASILHYAIHDLHLDEVVLDEAFDISLAERRTVIVRALAVPDRVTRPCFTKEPCQPEFTLEIDWVDLDWPRVVALDWEDSDTTPAFYYVRIEQIDGNIAWSSPIWFVNESPFGR